MLKFRDTDAAVISSAVIVFTVLGLAGCDSTPSPPTDPSPPRPVVPQLKNATGKSSIPKSVKNPPPLPAPDGKAQ